MSRFLTLCNGRSITWNGIPGYILALREHPECPVCIALSVRDQEPPQEGWLDDEQQEWVARGDAGDWIPLWVHVSSLRPARG